MKATVRYAAAGTALALPTAAIPATYAVNSMINPARAECATTGGRLIDERGHLQPSGRLFPSLLNEFLVLTGLAFRYPHSKFFGRFDRTWANSAEAAKVDWVPGAFTVIRREAVPDQILTMTKRRCPLV